MMDVCGIVPRTLSDEEKDHYSAVMASASPVIRSAADRFELTLPAFRRNFFKGELDTTPEEAQAVQRIKSVEMPVLEGYCRIVPRVARKFYAAEAEVKQAVVFDDYLQEGVCAISDAMYCYNGSKKFSTYLVWAVRNRLIDYIRKDNSLSPVKKRIIIKLRAKITKLMEKGKTFEQAADELALSNADRSECLASMATAKSVREDWCNGAEWDGRMTSYDHLSPEIFAKEQALKAFEIAPLSDFEREILDAHMHGKAISGVAKRHKRSRMAGTYALRRALDAVRETFETLDGELVPEAA